MSQAKLYAVIRRHPSMTPQEARDHWRHPHGTLGRRIPTIVKYVQSHQLDSDLLGPEQKTYEGVAEVWLDSIADALNYGEEPTRVRDVVPDEEKFIDLDELQFLWAADDVLVSSQGDRLHDAPEMAYWEENQRSTSIKIIQLIQKDGERPWRSDEDVQLGQRIGAFRHVRGIPLKELHGEEPPFLGVRELWWPTLTMFERGVAADRDAWSRLIDRPARSITMLAQAERVK